MPTTANPSQTALATLQTQKVDLSCVLSGIFRGRFCQILLQHRIPQKFEKGETLYDIGRNEDSFFFIRSGVVKIGTVTEFSISARPAKLSASCLHRVRPASTMPWPSNLPKRSASPTMKS